MSAAKKPARPRQKIRPGREEREDAPPESGRWNALILALILVLTAAVFEFLRNVFIDELDDDICRSNAAVRDLRPPASSRFSHLVTGNYHP
jgi:hypothetical protein